MQRIPNYIDDGKIIFLWPIDEFVLVAVVFGGGLVMGYYVTPLGVCFLALKGYKRLKEGKPRGFLKHLLYRKGLVWVKARTFPNPFVGRFAP